jgi:hypothetical protein
MDAGPKGRDRVMWRFLCHLTLMLAPAMAGVCGVALGGDGGVGVAGSVSRLAEVVERDGGGGGGPQPMTAAMERCEWEWEGSEAEPELEAEAFPGRGPAVARVWRPGEAESGTVRVTSAWGVRFVLRC